MIRTPCGLVSCLLLSLAFLPQTRAQSTAEANDRLKAILLRRGDEFMSALRKHDRARMASTLTADFIAVGGEAMATGIDDTLKVLMNCELTSYHISESVLKEVSTNAAILITKQHQQLTCFGHPAPAVVYATDTYVKRDGQWLILIHTEATPLTN